jgi:hypothetical protein
MTKKKHQPPAKIKYDKSHPTISIRVDQELKKKLDEIKEVSGKSVGDILREAVGVQAASAKSAYEKGYTKAKKEWGVTYKCAVCGGTMWIISPEEKKDAAQYMREHGWAHGKCLQKYG